MSYEISKIQNAELQKIALGIDKENKDAKTGNNGKIDYSEISLFAQKHLLYYQKTKQHTKNMLKF